MINSFGVTLPSLVKALTHYKTDMIDVIAMSSHQGCCVTCGTKYSRMDQVKFFKGCLPQILLGPFLNALSHVSIAASSFIVKYCPSWVIWA